MAEAEEGSDAGRLAEVLTQELAWPDQAEELAARAAAGDPTDATFDAHAVTIGATGVVVSHLYRRDQAPLWLTRDDFAGLLRAWAAFLRRSV